MIRVMVVDDSPLVRKIAGDILSSEPDIEVVATAATAEFALKKIKREMPDVITMDIEMPGIGGVEAIRQIMGCRPTPVIVLSSHAARGAQQTLAALEAGAIDFVLKPTASLSGGLDKVAIELREKVRSAAGTPLAHGFTEHPAPEGLPAAPKLEAMVAAAKSVEIVAIGTSTGGPVALKTVLEQIPGDFPVPIVVVQHMPPVFTKAFAERLDSSSALSIKEAEDGDLLLPGNALIAPGDYHMTVVRSFPHPVVRLDHGEPVSGHRPSVDVLMRSVAREYGRVAVGVIMTGMGKDGSEGIKELHSKGGRIIAQDKDTSVIFGMNREVIINGDADIVTPVQRIAEALDKLVVERTYATDYFNGAEGT